MNIQVRKSFVDVKHYCVSILDFLRPVSTGALRDPSYYDVIFDRVPLKRLLVNIHPNSANQKNCKAIQLAKNLLRHFSEVIEELSINGQHEQFIQDYVQDLSFRRLKTLKIIAWPKKSIVWDKNFISSLVSRAPNLQQLHTPTSLLPFMDEILERSGAVAVPSECLDPLHNQLPGSGFKRLRLEKITLFITRTNFNVERFNSLIPALLQKYRTTLTTLHIDGKCVGPLMSYGLCLPNVRELKIFTYISRIRRCEPVVRLLEAFDFTRILPALTKVFIALDDFDASTEDIQSFIEQGNAALTEPRLLLDRAVNIKHLCVLDDLSGRNVPFLSQTFPNIEILETRFFGLSHPSMRDQHADSDLCGIFPEEVDELRGKDDDFLKTVNIVPVMPTIACFNDLRTLKLTYKKLDAHEGNKDLLCSKVTGLLVFARCPNLSVTIHNKFPDEECEEALDHMKPYASVIVLRVTGERFDCEADELE